MAQQRAPFYSPPLHPLNPPPSFSFTFQTDTMQLFYPKGFKVSLLPEYKTPLPLELLMVAEKKKKKESQTPLYKDITGRVQV